MTARTVLAIAMLTNLVSLVAQDAWAYYAPPMGRFLTRDPIGYEDGANLYQYAQSSPTIALDPYGTKCTLRLRCNPAGGDSSGVGSWDNHCGIEVCCPPKKCFTMDGSGGDTNYFYFNDDYPTDPNDDDDVVPPTNFDPWDDTFSPRDKGNFSKPRNVPDTIVDCLIKEMKRWNAMNIPRDTLCKNSNWSMKCMLKKCGVTIKDGEFPTKDGKPPQGWNCRETTEYKCHPPDFPGDPAIWVPSKSEDVPCP